MADYVERVPDVELERLAKERGPSSVGARMVEELRKLRAKDRQIFAFRVRRLLVYRAYAGREDGAMVARPG